LKNAERNRSIYTVKKLKSILKELGEKVSGKKLDLIVRIETKFEKDTRFAKVDANKSINTFKNELLKYQEFIDDNRLKMTDNTLIKYCEELTKFYRDVTQYQYSMNKCLLLEELVAQQVSDSSDNSSTDSDNVMPPLESYNTEHEVRTGSAASVNMTWRHPSLTYDTVEPESTSPPPARWVEAVTRSRVRGAPAPPLAEHRESELQRRRHDVWNEIMREESEDERRLRQQLATELINEYLGEEIALTETPGSVNMLNALPIRQVPSLLQQLARAASDALVFDAQDQSDIPSNLYGPQFNPSIVARLNDAHSSVVNTRNLLQTNLQRIQDFAVENNIINPNERIRRQDLENENGVMPSHLRLRRWLDDELANAPPELRDLEFLMDQYYENLDTLNEFLNERDIIVLNAT
tara:strand:+ start:105 stop:1328 length:1224 start_codon:yes stop_codon:yes gene_type:complete